MTDLTPFRKAFILCSAVALTAGLSACGDKDLNKTFAQIKAIRVDAGDSPATAQADPEKLKTSDVALVVQTAKDLTVNTGGLIDRYGKDQKRLQIAVVDPLQMPRIDHGGALDERISETVSLPIDRQGADIVRAAMHDLPDLPIAAVQPTATPVKVSVKAPASAPLATPRSVPVKPQGVKTVAKTAEPVGRLVQIGSFGTMNAAQLAWSGLQSKYPAIGRYSPSYQKIVTASGQAMVRLKVGPVADDAQARTLCDRLDIRDNWCVKAG